MSKNSNIKVATCPYCQEEQPAWPKQSKKKCISCKQIMHVKCTTLIAKERFEGMWDGWDEWRDEVLMTDKEAWLCDQFYFLVAHEEPRKANYFQWKSKNDIQNESRYRDIVWGMLNILLIEYAKKEDYSTLSGIYRHQARLLEEEGKDQYEQLRLAGKMVLLNHKLGNYKYVEIESHSAKGDPVLCPECLAITGKRLPIGQALSELPLPPRDCKNRYCFTYYAQVFNQ